MTYYNKDLEAIKIELNEKIEKLKNKKDNQEENEKKIKLLKSIVDRTNEELRKTKLKRIINKIKQGELEREWDESGANGFWDYTYRMLNIYNPSEKEQQRVEEVYRTLWDLVEILL